MAEMDFGRWPAHLTVGLVMLRAVKVLNPRRINLEAGFDLYKKETLGFPSRPSRKHRPRRLWISLPCTKWCRWDFLELQHPWTASTFGVISSSWTANAMDDVLVSCWGQWRRPGHSHLLGVAVSLWWMATTSTTRTSSTFGKAWDGLASMPCWWMRLWTSLIARWTDAEEVDDQNQWWPFSSTVQSQGMHQEPLPLSHWRRWD